MMLSSYILDLVSNFPLLLEVLSTAGTLELLPPISCWTLCFMKILNYTSCMNFVWMLMILGQFLFSMNLLQPKNYSSILDHSFRFVRLWKNKSKKKKWELDGSDKIPIIASICSRSSGYPLDRFLITSIPRTEMALITWFHFEFE